MKIWCRIFLVIFFAWFETSASASNEDRIMIRPQEIKDNDSIHISLPKYVPSHVGVFTPSSKFIILHDEEYSAEGFHSFPTLSEIKLFVSELSGQLWQGGKPHIQKIFTVPGVYEFYFADNLETEVGNSNGICIMVYYNISKPTTQMSVIVAN